MTCCAAAEDEQRTGKTDLKNNFENVVSGQNRLLASLKMEREKFYPGPGIEPGCPVLQMSYPGHIPIHDRINN